MMIGMCYFPIYLGEIYRERIAAAAIASLLVHPLWASDIDCVLSLI